MTTPGKHAPTRNNPNRGKEEREDQVTDERDAVRNPSGTEPGTRKPEELDEEFERSLRDEDEDDDGDTIRR